VNDNMSASTGQNRHGFTLGAVLIILLVLAAYWPVWNGQFVWDDMLVVEKNSVVTGEMGLRTVWFQTDFTLTTVAFWIQWLLWGKNPTGYHAVNVLLHAINAVLVWRLLARLRIPGSWLAAALFAVHPVCVASVAWISELKNTLSLVFFLLSFWFYIRFETFLADKEKSTSATFPGRSSRDNEALTISDFGFWISDFRMCYWLSLGAFLLALLSKTSTVMLPVVLLACAWWQRGRIARRDLLRTIPFFVMALVFGLMSIWFQAHQASHDFTVQTENFWGRLAGAGMAIWFYLGKALLPLNLNLIYPHWEINATALASYIPILLWCGVLAVCWSFRRTWGRHALFGLGCFAVTLFPVLGFFDMYYLAISRVSDHLQYLPLIFVIALAASTLHALFNAKVLRFVAPLLVLTLFVLTMKHAQVFATEEGLWRDVLAKNPASWSAHNNLGSICAEQQKIGEAMEHFEASLKLNPQNAQAHCNLGRALALQGKFAEAESRFLDALKIKPDDADTHKSYGMALADQGKTDDAVKHLREAVRLQPDAETRLQLAALLRATGKSREAVAELRRLLSAKPNLPDALNNLAWLLAASPDETVRDGKEAVRFAEQACRLTEYKKAMMVGTLAAAYAEAARFAEAVATAQKAVELATADDDTKFAEVNRQLLELYRSGRPYHEPSAKTP
jgi:protein O-mannosyl-transferase